MLKSHHFLKIYARHQKIPTVSVNTGAGYSFEKSLCVDSSSISKTFLKSSILVKESYTQHLPTNFYYGKIDIEFTILTFFKHSIQCH